MGWPKHIVVEKPFDTNFVFKAPYVLFTGYLKDGANYSGNYHHHSCTEILLCSNGLGTVEIDGTIYNISEGDIVIFDSNITHQERCDPKDPMSFFFLGVDDFRFPPFPPNTLRLNEVPPVCNSGVECGLLEVLFTQLSDEVINQPPHYKAMSALLASCIIMHILRIFRVASEEANDETISRSLVIKDYIDRNYTSMINLDTLSQSAYISKDYLSHVFKRDMGVSPIEYIIKKRIILAQQLLKSTTMTIADIANEVGYPDPAYFSQVFKRVTGKSPKGYRES